MINRKILSSVFFHRATKAEIRKDLIQRMLDDDMRRIFRNSCFLIAVSKSLSIASPWFLKGVVDMMSISSVGALSFSGLCFGITAFGMTRLLSTIS